MLNPPLLEGLAAQVVETPRLRTHVITRGPDAGEPMLLVHGNGSAARFYEELMLAIPQRFRLFAPDLRGYGRSEAREVDATRGVRDFSDDLYALVQTLGLGKVHLVGHSLGGVVVMQYTHDHPAEVASLTLVASGSPFGFSATHGPAGTPVNAEFSGSGAGGANPGFVQLLRDKDRGSESPASPRNVINTFYWKPPFRPAREDVLLDELLLMQIGDGHYPGDAAPATAWPGFAPGTRGILNSLSPKYVNLAGLADIQPKPPLLWIHGDSDQIVADQSLFDAGYLGQIGALPGWPGAELHPPQPMITQLRTMLERYQANGGRYQEVLIADCGHTPYIEKPAEFGQAFAEFLATV